MTIAALAAAGLLVGSPPVRAQPSGAPPQLAPIPRECQAPGVAVAQESPLPNVGKALRTRKKIVILAIGGASVARRDPRIGGYYGLVEDFLEKVFKGVDVVIVQRGVSGELARDAAERIRTEVALNSPDLVLWQLGTADAMAQLPTDEFAATARQTIDWLKAHDVDVALIGMRYARALAKDPQYQAIRLALAEIAREKGILRISRYEAVETIARIRAQKGEQAAESELTETAYTCMAEYLARAIAAGLFAKSRQPLPAPKR